MIRPGAGCSGSRSPSSIPTPCTACSRRSSAVAEERVRIELAFDGGQIMGAYVELRAADELERALGEGRDGAIALEAEDGLYTVALKRVVYLKRFSREGRVGFTSG